MSQRHSRSGLPRCKHYGRGFRLLPGDGSSSAQRWSPSSRPRSAACARAGESPQPPPRSQAQPGRSRRSLSAIFLGFPGGGRCSRWAPAKAQPAGRRYVRRCLSTAGDGAGAGRCGQALSLHDKPMLGHLSHTAVAHGARGGPAMASRPPTPAATVAATAGARRIGTAALRVASHGAYL